MMGAVGGPKWDDVPRDLRPEMGLLQIRKGMDVFANLRPAFCFPALVDASSLKREFVDGLDIMIVRELTSGVYFGEPRGIVPGPMDTSYGFETSRYTAAEIKRVARVAFEIARGRGGEVCSVEKNPTSWNRACSGAARLRLYTPVKAVGLSYGTSMPMPARWSWCASRSSLMSSSRAICLGISCQMPQRC